jgi:hypothetical protein
MLVHPTPFFIEMVGGQAKRNPLFRFDLRAPRRKPGKASLIPSSARGRICRVEVILR